jgi:hypothetical protein
VHQYPTTTTQGATGTGMTIRWQQGPIIDDVANGALPELLVRTLIDRLEYYQHAVSCPQNQQAIALLNEILHLFDQRTRDRYQRGVMGTTQL